MWFQQQMTSILLSLIGPPAMFLIALDLLLNLQGVPLKKLAKAQH